MAASKVGRAVEFYYDISCPFAYIASTRIEALAARTSARIIWRPVLLGAIYRATNAPQGAAGSASDVFNPTKKAVTSRAFQRTIQRFGIPYNEPPQHPLKTTGPLRLLYFVDESQRPQLTKALFRAYWVEGKDVGAKAVLSDIVRQSGISGADKVVKAIDDGSFESDKQRQELEASTDTAVERGCPGVPGFWLPDEIAIDKNGKQTQGRLYWGQDRLHFLEAAIESLNEGRNGDEWQSLSKRSLSSLIPRCARGQKIANNEEVKMEFWYDFSSPWAFLGWTELARLQRQFGDKLQIEMKPFLLGILFRQIGAPDVPMKSYSKQKVNYVQQDHKDWVKWLNAVNVQEGKPDKNVDFYWADNFPIRTPSLLRAAIVEPKLVGPLFRACWERNLNISSDDVLKQVITEAGYDGDDILARSNEGPIKTELRARTKEAADVGICGVPSYRVFRRKAGEGDEAWKMSGDIVWGQDELAVIEDSIAGWNGQGVAEVGSEPKSRL